MRKRVPRKVEYSSRHAHTVRERIRLEEEHMKWKEIFRNINETYKRTWRGNTMKLHLFKKGKKKGSEDYLTKNRSLRKMEFGE